MLGKPIAAFTYLPPEAMSPEACAAFVRFAGKG